MLSTFLCFYPTHLAVKAVLTSVPCCILCCIHVRKGDALRWLWGSRKCCLFFWLGCETWLVHRRCCWNWSSGPTSAPWRLMPLLLSQFYFPQTILYSFPYSIFLETLKTGIIKPPSLWTIPIFHSRDFLEDYIASGTKRQYPGLILSLSSQIWRVGLIRVIKLLCCKAKPWAMGIILHILTSPVCCADHAEPCWHKNRDAHSTFGKKKLHFLFASFPVMALKQTAKCLKAPLFYCLTEVTFPVTCLATQPWNWLQRS